MMVFTPLDPQSDITRASNWFLSLSLVFSLQTIRSVKLYILTSQTAKARLTFRKGVIIKFRCRNYQNFGWLARSEHDRPNLLSTVRRDFALSEIFLWKQNIFDSQLFCRRPVEIILRPLAGRREGSLLCQYRYFWLREQWQSGLTRDRCVRHFNRQLQSVGFLEIFIVRNIPNIFLIHFSHHKAE